MTQVPSLNFLQGTAANPSDFTGIQEENFDTSGQNSNERQVTHGITPQLQYVSIIVTKF